MVIQETAMNKWLSVTGLVVLAACGAETESVETIAVRTNDLGIASLQVDRYEEAGESIYELRGLGQGTELAKLRMRVGIIDDLEELTDVGKRGTELTMSVGTETTRLTTHAVPFELLEGMPGFPAVETFLTLPEVTGALQRHVGLYVKPSHEILDEGAYYSQSCASGNLRPTPLAVDCCQWEVFFPGESAGTYHINPANPRRIVRRQGNTFATHTCRTATGGSNCSGGACTYGPCGYAQPTFIDNGSNYPVLTHNGSTCQYSWSATQVDGALPNVTGTCPYNDCNNGVPYYNPAGGGGVWSTNG
jgi:hypothetical protein